ncbi:MAG: transposase family protein [Conexibacter sp.]|nr:transposase family protein [Conexibacter sp.]
MARGRKYPPELRERAVKMVLESGDTLRNWVRLAQADAGMRSDVLNSSERDRMSLLEREVKELRRQNEILRAARVFFASELDGTPRR